LRKLFLIGIGTGNPDHVTVQAIKALANIDVVFLLDKGEGTAELLETRRAICERYIQKPYRQVELTDTERDPQLEYKLAVERWHEQRLALYEDALARELGESGHGAILVWGDPSLYDSTVRIAQSMTERARVPFEYEVIPGISSPQVLAARHKIALNRIGGAVQLTTGRRLSAGMPAGVDDCVVMLDGSCAFNALPAEGLHIYWGAYLGTEYERLVAGPLEQCKAEIEHVRQAARAEHGWIMDTYLLRRPG
jgi:precorrin-6A synthase